VNSAITGGDSEAVASPLYQHISDLSADGMAGKVWSIGEQSFEIALGPGPNFHADIDGGQEVPPVGTPATGQGSFQLLADGTLQFKISYSGLLSPETAAHIHGPAPPGMNAGVLFPLPAGNPKFGTTPVLTGVQRTHLQNGQLYVNIHTTGNPGGEIRGQIVPQSDEITYGPTPCTASPSCTIGSLCTVGLCTQDPTCTLSPDCTGSPSCTQGSGCTQGQFCTVSPGCTQGPTCTTGPWCTMGANCTFGPAACTAGQRCTFGVCTNCTNCTSGNNCTFGPGACTIGIQCTGGDFCTHGPEACTLGDNCTAGSGACTGGPACTGGAGCTQDPAGCTLGLGCTFGPDCTAGGACTGGAACTFDPAACTAGPNCTAAVPGCTSGATCTTGPVCGGGGVPAPENEKPNTWGKIKDLYRD
jgi:hypothetical protein